MYTLGVGGIQRAPTYTLPSLTVIGSDEISKPFQAGVGFGKIGILVMVTGRDPSSVPGAPLGPLSSKTTICTG
jgi:hypothetical protein